MQYRIDDNLAKKFSLKDLNSGNFFEWNNIIYMVVDLALNMDNLLKTPTLHKDKIFVLIVAENKMSYFDNTTEVTLLREAPIQFTRVV